MTYLSSSICLTPTSAELAHAEADVLRSVHGSLQSRMNPHRSQMILQLRFIV